MASATSATPPEFASVSSTSLERSAKRTTFESQAHARDGSSLLLMTLNVLLALNPSAITHAAYGSQRIRSISSSYLREIH
ncbi:hypothetical protein BJX96DRAFT_150975 [Aspergillus floccosus]